MRSVLRFLFLVTLAVESFGSDVLHYFDGDILHLQIIRSATSPLTAPPHVAYNNFPLCYDLFDSREGSTLLHPIHLKRDQFCEELCVMDMGQRNSSVATAAIDAILSEYRVGLVVVDDGSGSSDDSIRGLRNSSIHENKMRVVDNMGTSFPLGYVSEEANGKSNDYFLYNHIDIKLAYRKLKAEKSDRAERYQLTGLAVHPFSVNYNVTISPDGMNNSKQASLEGDGETEGDGLSLVTEKTTMSNSIESCTSLTSSPRNHTGSSLLKASVIEPQPTSGHILFTYDVIWIEDKDNDIPVSKHEKSRGGRKSGVVARDMKGNPAVLIATVGVTLSVTLMIFFWMRLLRRMQQYRRRRRRFEDSDTADFIQLQSDDPSAKNKSPVVIRI